GGVLCLARICPLLARRRPQERVRRLRRRGEEGLEARRSLPPRAPLPRPHEQGGGKPQGSRLLLPARSRPGRKACRGPTRAPPHGQESLSSRLEAFHAKRGRLGSAEDSLRSPDSASAPDREKQTSSSALPSLPRFA